EGSDRSIAHEDAGYEAPDLVRLDAPRVDPDRDLHLDVAFDELDVLASVRARERQDSGLLEPDRPTRAALESRVDLQRVPGHRGDFALRVVLAEDGSGAAR